MFNLMIISKREYALILEQRDSALKLAASERTRADRLLDQVVMMAGQEPVSDAAVEIREEQAKVAEKREMEVAEIFSDNLEEIIPQDKEYSPTNVELLNEVMTVLQKNGSPIVSGTPRLEKVPENSAS